MRNVSTFGEELLKAEASREKEPTVSEKNNESGFAKGKNPAYSAQYKFLAGRSQLRVWVIKDKYESFKMLAAKNGTSIYRLINEYIDEYLEKGSSDSPW